ncbi:hypothetical protein IJS77_00540, partial [bacterium]|nr:hypothetical protein [bacterium]
RKILLTQLKENFNLRLMIIRARGDRMTAESTALEQKKAQIQTAQLQSLASKGLENITSEDLQNVINATAEVDMEVQLIDLKEEDMDAETQMLNSLLAEIDAELENIEKAEEKAIKDSFGAFANK